MWLSIWVSSIRVSKWEMIQHECSVRTQAHIIPDSQSRDHVGVRAFQKLSFVNESVIESGSINNRLGRNGRWWLKRKKMATASHLEMERAEVPRCSWLQQPQNTPLHSLLITHVPIKCSNHKNCLKVYHSLHYYYCDAGLKNTTRKSIHLLKLNKFLHNGKVCNLILINYG